MIEDMNDLVGLVAESYCNPCAQGPVLIIGTLWDGRRIRASHSSSSPSAETPEEVFRDKSVIESLVARLLQEGKEFVIRLGSGENQRTLVWRIESAK